MNKTKKHLRLVFLAESNVITVQLVVGRQIYV